jgi:hypothetical protein
MTELPKMTPKLKYALIYTHVVYLIMAILGVLFSENAAEFALSFLVGVAGGAVGSLLGTLASPYSHGEKTAFSEYMKAIATFLGGFMLSKLDKLLVMVADPKNLTDHPVYGARVLVFVIVLVTSAITIYIFRMYYEGGEGPSDRVEANAAL